MLIQSPRDMFFFKLNQIENYKTYSYILTKIWHAQQPLHPYTKEITYTTTLKYLNPFTHFVKYMACKVNITTTINKIHPKLSYYELNLMDNI